MDSSVANAQSMDVDLDHVTLLCEWVALRQRVLADGNWWDRVALRALDDQIDRMMGALGLNPTDRAKLDVVSLVVTNQRLRCPLICLL
jgi:hypothetical protein